MKELSEEDKINQVILELDGGFHFTYEALVNRGILTRNQIRETNKFLQPYKTNAVSGENLRPGPTHRKRGLL